MKVIIVLSALLVLSSAETYNSENDDLDIEKLVSDPASLGAFLDCFNDKGACDELSGDFKKDLREAVEQACEKCTAAQKHIFKRFLEVIKVQKADDYKIFQQKYDPENKYLPALEAAIAKY
ncbi:ejaculatory bulb-specific protein 3-like isoform X2 [Danaus plexippus]|uniref:Chemosensory protein 11b n=2 Tax=Danaus plexippus TaxID=13037 RepID=A0A212F7V3_DANPL|nr:ejaculatory bulb-specific protein 3-like isoform X2 [Danaus plexippus plexippus]XP_032519911.1 ejaculatory bulb-specific protein 3-like isoform X2 [Danaus plexippus]OWR49810.1 chemosensory protein 11b [Danaus plexippus plexippus]